MKLVAYYRVSTGRQGRSGLGIKGQKATVEAYSREKKAEIIREFREVESGGKNDRPIMAKAMAHCRMTGAALVVAKVDRLSRDVRFILELVDSDVQIIFCEFAGRFDMENRTMSRLFLTICGIFAEFERDKASERTRSALAAYKASGGKLGSHRDGHPGMSEECREAGRAASAERRKAKVRKYYENIAPELKRMRTMGMTLRESADELNKRGIFNAARQTWNHATVHKVCELFGIKGGKRK